MADQKPDHVLKALIVDDDRAIRSDFREMLERSFLLAALHRGDVLSRKRRRFQAGRT